MGADRIRNHFVTSIPSPYQVDFFCALEKLVPRTFKVTFSSAREIDRQYYDVPDEFSFQGHILSHKTRRLGKDWHRSSELATTLSASAAQNFIVGGNYFMPDARTTRHLCLAQGKKFFFWGENPFKKQESGPKRWLKEKYLHWFLGPATGVIGVGSSATDAYKRLSGSDRVACIPYAPDLESLITPSEALENQAAQLRSGLGESDFVYVLYVGSLISRKDPATLIQGFARVASRLPSARLLIAGEGPLLPELAALVVSKQLEERVTFLGFLKSDELKAAYLAADLFVLPTCGHEGWGVVIQEAMAAGLPVIASSRVGAAKDLIGPGRIGRLFEAESVDGLAAHLLELIQDETLRKRIGRQSRDVAIATSANCAARKFLEFMAVSNE